MGLVVVGLGLLDIAIWFIVLNAVYQGESTALVTITTTMLTFGMGASTQALFARVGGGIYTKHAAACHRSSEGNLQTIRELLRFDTLYCRSWSHGICNER